MQKKENTTDMKKLLGTAGAATTTIRMILSIRLLSQFQATEVSKEDEEEID